MKILNYIVAALLLIVAFFFYRFVFQNAVNIPFFDDYAYLEYIIKFEDAPNLWHFLRELEYKHNGHGVITAKLVFWLDYLLTGEVNYRTLIVAGSGLAILLFGYFWKVLSVNKIPFYCVLPVGLLLFTPAYHENIFWAAALWQYTASFVLGIATYYLLAMPQRWALIGAIIAGFLTTYTNGNGLFGMYVGVVIPLLQSRYPKAIIWIVACAITTVVFYWYYPFGFGSLGQEKSFRNSFLTLLSFFGASASYLRGRLTEVAILGTAVSLALISLALRLAISYLRMVFLKNASPAPLLSLFLKNSANLSLIGLLAWLLLTGLGVATARAGQALETPARYMIYSVMAVVSLYVTFLLIFPRRFQSTLAVVMTAFGIVFALGTYLFAAPDVINFRNTLVADTYNLPHHRRVSGKLETMTNLVVKQYFDEAIKRGIYHLPTPIVSSKDLMTYDSTQLVKIPFSFDLDTLPAYGGVIINKIQNETVVLDESSPENAVFLVLRNDSTAYLASVRQHPNHGRKSFIQTGHHFGKGFAAQIYQDNIPEGDYQLGLMYYEGPKTRVVYTTQRFKIQDFRK
ncbi:hypothetical protein P1X15_12635 [Runella sp. MFBS21]|uniref:hypothetical protein n=1 Tax=Runella sp. MFBS21 TaxID=3034018 RepID=UPI0023F88DEB|nr:hypothetical protein [Runella sp. MFBS21]MDF7818453.1 hypothetical protein [Runella sp. MFBS21]